MQAALHLLCADSSNHRGDLIDPDRRIKEFHSAQFCDDDCLSPHSGHFPFQVLPGYQLELHALPCLLFKGMANCLWTV
jgi:hypothetical protein